MDLAREAVDARVLDRSVAFLREAGVLLPTFSQLKNPATIPAAVRHRLTWVDPDVADPLNLFRVHWFNDASRRGFTAPPVHIELPPELSGVNARIVLAQGNCFPMIRAHKVLAAYGCLVPRLVTGRFDPTRDRAIWPSTGNYCRGEVAISRILGCRGVAVLPEHMSRERFRTLSRARPPFRKLQRVIGAEQIEVFPLPAPALRQQKEVLEYRVLSDRFVTAPPANEFELRDAKVRLKIELAAGVTGPERDVFDLLARLQDVREAQ